MCHHSVDKSSFGFVLHLFVLILVGPCEWGHRMEHKGVGYTFHSPLLFDSSQELQSAALLDTEALVDPAIDLLVKTGQGQA